MADRGRVGGGSRPPYQTCGVFSFTVIHSKDLRDPPKCTFQSLKSEIFSGEAPQHSTLVSLYKPDIMMCYKILSDVQNLELNVLYIYSSQILFVEVSNLKFVFKNIFYKHCHHVTCMMLIDFTCLFKVFWQFYKSHRCIKIYLFSKMFSLLCSFLFLFFSLLPFLWLESLLVSLASWRQVWQWGPKK